MTVFIRRQTARLRRTLDEYPRPFWILTLATFIDSLGGFMLFPFFSLYITQKFGVGMTQVGLLFGLFSITDLAGSFVGGALTDRFGRKALTLFGLIVSAFVMLLLGLAATFEQFALAALIVGTFASVGGPARQAMVADILPESQRAEGFGLLRVVFNVSATVAPAIGGLLAARSYLLIFVADAVISAITAVIVYVALPETKPRMSYSGAPRESVVRTFLGYGQVLRDAIFMAFAGVCVLMGIVYIQINTTLGVYLRDVHSITPEYYGYLISLNAVIVVLFQFAVTRRVKAWPEFLAMAIGTALYAVGFGMYGFVGAYPMFLLAMVIITIGEMIVSPVGQALVARLSPEAMRGRYMAIFGFSWAIPSMVGPLLAGLTMDHLDPRWVWYSVGLIGLVTALGFVGLGRVMGKREAKLRAAAEPAA